MIFCAQLINLLVDNRVIIIFYFIFKIDLIMKSFVIVALCMCALSAYAENGRVQSDIIAVKPTNQEANARKARGVGGVGIVGGIGLVGGGIGGPGKIQAIFFFIFIEWK